MTTSIRNLISGMDFSHETADKANYQYRSDIVRKQQNFKKSPLSNVCGLLRICELKADKFDNALSNARMCCSFS